MSRPFDSRDSRVRERPLCRGTRHGLGRWFWLLVLFPLFACHALGRLEDDQHIIQFNGEGRPVQPTTHWTADWFPLVELSDEEYEAHLDELFETLLAEAPRDAAGRPRVLIFIHGGLNNDNETTQRAIDYEAKIRDDYWPIFLNWNSSLVSCYGDHLLFVRQGRNWGWWGAPLAPFYLVTDLGHGVAQFPAAVYTFTVSFLQSLPGVSTPQEKLVGSTLEHYATGDSSALEDGRPPMDISVGKDSFSGPAAVFDFAIQTLTRPLSLVEQPLLSGFGSAAWDVMQRRIFLLFHPETEFLGRSGREDAHGLPRFLNRLREVQQRENLSITLVGHSMGTIVANELLVHEPELEVETLVYMAAAASLRDCEEVLLPYLREHPESELYFLTLHPKAEVREKQFLDLTPRGSLLVWVDGFLADPLTPLDGVSGNFNNLVLFLDDIPDEVRSQIHIRAYSTGQKASAWEPQKHGDFTERPFWRPSFWQAKPWRSEALVEPPAAFVQE